MGLRLGPVIITARALVLILGVLYVLLPIAWVVSVALRPPGLVTFPVSIIPQSVTLDNFVEVLSGRRGIGIQPYLNSALYGTSAAISTAVIALLGGYALARYEVRFGRLIVLMFLGLYLLPAAARLVPLFLLYVTTGLYDTQVGIVLAYVAGAIPLGIWIMAATIRQIPVRLEQAARVDGAGPLLIARRIILPLAMPGVFVVALLAFVDGWNAFSLPLILTQRADFIPYTVALQTYVQADVGVTWTLLAAGSLLALIPVLVIFAILYRRLVSASGLSGAVQG